MSHIFRRGNYFGYYFQKLGAFAQSLGHTVELEVPTPENEQPKATGLIGSHRY
jgi:hypothetical protein